MKNQKNLIVNLFNNEFNLKDFINFTNEVFKGKAKYGNNLEFSPKVKGEFNSVVKSFLNLGRYTDNNKKSMILAVVELRNEDSIARSRTIQRNFVKDYFLKSGADAALVAFYNKESEDWRLSFIKLDYSYKNSKLQEDITPAKRFSFLLGKNEKHHTAVRRFMPLILQDKEPPTVDELEEVFNIEVVTKEFFEKYCDLYLKIKKELDNQEGFSLVAEKADIKSDEFAKKLMGQLVFLYFLQKKGWLGVKVNPEKILKEEADKLLDNKTYECNDVFDKVYYLTGDTYIRDAKKIIELSNEEIYYLNSIFINTEYDEKWGSGDKSFIRSMFKEADNCGKNFFKDYLEPIFYNALNDKRGGSTYFKDLNCKIPFLNGGLFQPISENYNYKNADFTIDNSIFSNNTKNKQGDIGDGVLDIFDRYAFTIKEDEPLEKEVAVDPEMLGKVFENLLDVTDRKKKGAFYTPREIVHYMCQESLINYLITEINLNYDEAESLIRYGDIINDIDSNINVLSDGEFKMPYNIRYQAKKIDTALENVKVADPSVGSGAFPLGMVNEIVRARMNLTYYIMNDLDAVSRNNTKIKGRTPYDLKLKTIRRCIHAVDIERSAVDITKLRLWLSLVVEENDFRNIKALPNLDYNIMVGNSLIEEFEGVKLFNENALKNQDNKEKDNILEQLSLQIPIKDNEKILESISRLDRKLKNTSDIIEAKKIEYELEEAKKSFNEISASCDLKKESEYILDEIYRLQEEFFDANGLEVKVKLKNSIDNLEWLLIEKTIKENGNEPLLHKIKEFKRTNTKPYFLWKLNFARVFKEKNGFDIVIGNPPYVGEKGNKEIFRPIANSELGKRFYQGKMDLFYFFFHKAIDISRNNGVISFITTNYYITADSAIKLRKDFKERTNVIKLMNFNELKIFESALGQHNLITVLRKSTSTNSVSECINVNKLGFADNQILSDIFSGKDKETKYINKNHNEIFEGELFYIRMGDSNGSVEQNIIDKLLENTTILSNRYIVNTGVNTGCDYVTEANYRQAIGAINEAIGINKGDGIFVLNEEELKNLNLTDEENKYVYKFYKNSDIDRYYAPIKWSGKYLLYITKDVDINTLPNIKMHLDKYRAFCELKREYKEGKLPWYSLHWAREIEVFTNYDKIVLPYRSKRNIFAWSNKDFFGSKDILYIRPKGNNENVKLLLAFLNSKLCYYWLLKRGKVKGDTLELYVTPISQIPIKDFSKSINENINKYVNEIINILDKINLKEKEKQIQIKLLQKQIDECLYEAYNLTENEILEIEEIYNGKV